MQRQIEKQTMNTKLEDFKNHARWILSTSLDDQNVYLIKDKNNFDNWGFLIVGEEGELLDNCCDKCKIEPVLYFSFKQTEDFPHTSTFGIIGYTKFNLIKENLNENLLGDKILCEKLA